MLVSSVSNLPHSLAAYVDRFEDGSYLADIRHFARPGRKVDVIRQGVFSRLDHVRYLLLVESAYF